MSRKTKRFSSSFPRVAEGKLVCSGLNGVQWGRCPALRSKRLHFVEVLMGNKLNFRQRVKGCAIILCVNFKILKSMELGPGPSCR